MGRGLARPRGKALVAALLVCGFALVMSVAPVFHHDFECHLKSPTHCPACLASPAALGHPAVHTLGVATGGPSEAVPGPCLNAPDPPVLTALKGRSPPV